MTTGAMLSKLSSPTTRAVLLIAPCCVFLLIFYVYPLGFMIKQSAPNASFSVYADIFSSRVYLQVMSNTFRAAVIVTALCMLLAIPYAWAMARAEGLLFLVLSLALLVPFWVSILLRTFSWQVLLQDSGLINDVLQESGLTSETIPLIRNEVGLLIGMTHVLLPYAVLPIYAVMRRLSNNVLDAADISGASVGRKWLRVILPLSMPGILASGVLTFTLSLGFYITPALLGGPRNTMVAQVIANAIGAQRNVALGSALAVILLAATILAFAALGAVFWLQNYRDRHRLERSA